MQSFPASPLDAFASAWRHRALLSSLVRRDVLGRYRGSVMGILWSFFNPLFMLAVYTFVFSVVFEARWGAADESRTEFALVLFAGLLVFNLFAECVIRAPTLILSHQNYVKKIVFPLEILPWMALGSALFHALISVIVWVVAYLLLRGLPPVTLVYFPIVLIPLMLFVLGLMWALASLGVYIRDMPHVVGILTTTLMFLTPLFYPASALPEQYRAVLMANPMASVVEQARGALYWGVRPDMAVLGVNLLIGFGVAWLGFAWFQKTRRGFADVL
jgi:lipopolysaccharide transport system permease protein